MARVAVVIVNWNGESLLPACLGALREQSHRDFTVIFVDNASGDASIACAERELPAAEVIRSATNVGFAQGNNLGIARALLDPATDYVLTLNNDAVPAPDFLERLLAGAQASSPEYGSWQGKVVSADDPRVLDAIGIELAPDSVPSQVAQRKIDVGQLRSGPVYGVNAAAALYSRRFIEAMLLDGEFFDAEFFTYLEDVDIAVRGVAAGWKAGFVADAIVRHVGSATGGEDSAFKWRISSRNRLFLQLKNYSGRDLLASFGPTLAAELRLVLGFVRTQRSLLAPYLTGRLQALASLRPMLAKRRALHRRRVAGTIFAEPRPPLSGPADGVALSVVIPNHNGRDELAECLAALRSQTLGAIEVVVVDNGSNDGSVEFIRAQFPEVVALPLPSNLGFAAAVNIGINASNGDCVALLNNDAVAEPEWAAELLAALDHGDAAAALMVRADDPSIIDSAGEALSRWGLPYPVGRGEPVARFERDGYPEIFAASGGASIYRRAVLERVGVFDTQFFAYLEDVDLGFRVRAAGYRIVLAPRARVRHKQGTTAGRTTQFALGQFISNSYVLLLKNMPLPTLAKVLPRFALIHALLFAGAVVRGAGATAARAHAGAALALPLILVKRLRTQRRRTVPASELERWLTDRWPARTTPRMLLRPRRLRGQLMRELLPRQ